MDIEKSVQANMSSLSYLLLLSIGLTACGSSGVSTPTVVPLDNPASDATVCSEQFPVTPVLDDDYYQMTVCEWPVYMKVELYEDDKALPVFNALKSDLGTIQAIIPPAALSALKQTNIWLELDAGDFSGGEYHPSSQWLADNGYPVKWARGIQIANAQNYLTWEGYQPALVLHELAHAYDDQYYGSDHPGLLAAFNNATTSGIYDAVEYVDANAGLQEAYALENAKEYFAELTEAYFWKNDFYPFNKMQLQEHDPQGFEAVEAMWQQR